MAGKLLNTKEYLRGSVALLALMALVACDENGEFGLGSGRSLGTDDAASSDTAAVAAPAATGERDIEAPEIFQVNESGLWDGRPSLGGVWVAHPDVTDPERVIIRNPENNKTVIGALFRRDANNPGPALQISSDAATELGVLAGAPTTLSVIALRREETTETGPVNTAVTDFETAGAIEATPLDPIAGTAAAIDAAAETPATIEAPAAEPLAPVAAAAAPSSTLEKPFIQIGIFSVEENANRNADQLRSAGVSAQVLAQESQGRSFWRVIVGPAPTAADRASALETVKGLGFADAYFVTN